MSNMKCNKTGIEADNLSDLVHKMQVRILEYEDFIKQVITYAGNICDDHLSGKCVEILKDD